MKLNELLKFVTIKEELYLYDWQEDKLLFHGTKKEIKLEDYSAYEIVSIHSDYTLYMDKNRATSSLDIYLKKVDFILAHEEIVKK